jgi:hypothetical protein
MKEGCPWRCGSRRSGTCADRLMLLGFIAALLIAMVVSVWWGYSALRIDGDSLVSRQLCLPPHPGIADDTAQSNCHRCPRAGIEQPPHAADVRAASG